MTDPSATDTGTANTRPLLVTVQGGLGLHVSTCWIARQAARRSGWVIVDLGDSGAVARHVAGSELLPCKKCKPISRLAWWERYHRGEHR